MTSVTVRGFARVRAAPDEAALELTVESLRPTPAEALAEAAARAEELVALCDELGIGPERRLTSGATVEEQVEFVDGARRHRGYLARSSLRVRVEDPALAGRLLTDAVSRAGARVAGPWWSIAPANPARLDACREAALDARRKAEAYADALGARLGAIVAVREPAARVWPEPRGGVAVRAMLAADAPEPAPIEAGDLEVTAAVEVEFGLEQG